MQPCSWKNCITLCFGSLENVELLAYPIKVKGRGRIQMLCCFSFFLFIIIYHRVCGFVCIGLYECLLCVGVHGELHWVFIRWILGVCMITRNPNSNLGIAQMLIVLSLCHESCQKKKKVFLLPKHEEIILVSFPRIDRNYKYKVSCNWFLLKFHYSLFWFLRKCRTLAA